MKVPSSQEQETGRCFQSLDTLFLHKIYRKPPEIWYSHTFTFSFEADHGCVVLRTSDAWCHMKEEIIPGPPQFARWSEWLSFCQVLCAAKKPQPKAGYISGKDSARSCCWCVGLNAMLCCLSRLENEVWLPIFVKLQTCPLSIAQPGRGLVAPVSQLVKGQQLYRWDDFSRCWSPLSCCYPRCSPTSTF